MKKGFERAGLKYDLDLSSKGSTALLNPAMRE